MWLWYLVWFFFVIVIEPSHLMCFVLFCFSVCNLYIPEYPSLSLVIPASDIHDSASGISALFSMGHWFGYASSNHLFWAVGWDLETRFLSVTTLTVLDLAL